MGTVHLTIGYDPQDSARPREVFYAAGFRSGSQMEFELQDACVLISLLLQHGHMSKDIGQSLSKVENHTGNQDCATLIGLIIDALARDINETAQ